MSQISERIEQAERLAQELRPAQVVFSGKEIPCTPGNYDFFERLAVGGFSSFNGLFVKILRGDIPEGIEFKRGQFVTVKDLQSGDAYELQVGENNSQQTDLLILNLESSKG